MFHAVTTKDQMRAIKRDLVSLRKDLERLPSALRRDSKRRLDDTRERFWDAAGEMGRRYGESLGDFYGRARQRGAVAVERSRSSIERRPLTMLIGAFLAGIVVGKLARRR